MADEQIDRLHIDISETGAKQVISQLEKIIADSTNLEASLRGLINQLNSANSAFNSAAQGAAVAAGDIKKVDNISFNKTADNAEKLTEKLKDLEEEAKDVANQAKLDGKGGEQTPKTPETPKSPETPKEPEKGGFNVENVTEIAKQFGLVNGKAEDVAKTIAKFAPALADVVPAVGAMSVGFGALVKLGQFALNETKKVASFMGNAIKAGAEKAIDHVKNKIQSITQPFEKLFDRIFRVALNRFLRFAMKQITEAFNTGLQNVARGMESANKVLSVYATRMMYLKNTLGAALVPLLQALTPMFLRVTDAIIRASNAINQFLSLLAGKSTYIKAKEQYVDYAASLDKSSKKAKKSIQKLTASFDELHDITETASNGDDTDYASYFTTAGIEADIDSFYKKILKGFEQGDLSEVGSILAGKINASIDKIYNLVRWDKVGTKVTNYSKALGSLVNSLVNDVDFAKIGLTFSAGLNTIVKAINTFMEELFSNDTFTKLGAQLGTMLYTAIVNIKWAEIGKFFLDKLIAAFNIADGFLSYMLEDVDKSKDYKPRIAAMVEEVFTGLAEAMREKASKIESFGNTISKFFIAIFEAGAAMFGNSQFWTELAKAISGIINKIRENKEQLTSSLTKFVKALVGMVAEFLRIVDLSAIMKDISDIILDVLDDPDVQKNLQTVGEKMGEIAGKWFVIKFQAKMKVLPSIISSAVAGFFGIKAKPTAPKNSSFGTTVAFGWTNSSTFATGGFPEDGLFLANHTELIGKFSNGKTAVANNEQIIEGVAGGVERGMRAALSSTNSNNGSNEYNFYIDSKKMAKAIAKDVFGEANRAGLTLRTAKA